MLLCVQSHYGAPGVTFREAQARGTARVIRQGDLQASHLSEASALITSMHLDQVGFMRLSEALSGFLDRGGRWFFNGHILRLFVAGLGIYQPIRNAGRADLHLTELADHPVFSGIDRAALGARKGVAGFYGRGYNPPPVGALQITGLGPDLLPVDWDWRRPGGGRIFSHAGNDLPGACASEADQRAIACNILNWVTSEGCT